jgi:hypothetical protein
MGVYRDRTSSLSTRFLDCPAKILEDPEINDKMKKAGAVDSVFPQRRSWMAGRIRVWLRLAAALRAKPGAGGQ